MEVIGLHGQWMVEEIEWKGESLRVRVNRSLKDVCCLFQSKS